MSPIDDDFFLDDDEPEQKSASAPPWVMLIVDDEAGVHDVTRLALKDFTFSGRGLELVSAFTGEEALEILRQRDDVAVILLDVVMETDHAGLDCARRIRDELDNSDVRIVLRTGQPGVAPEREVILGYDINDYKAKTELTAQHLFTTVIAALRSYADIQELNAYRRDAYELAARQNSHESQILDLLPTPVFHFDSLGVISGCNKAFLELLKAAKEDVIGFDCLEVLPQEAAKAFEAIDLGALKEGDRTEATLSLENRNYRFSLVALTGSGNHDVGFVGLYLAD